MPYAAPSEDEALSYRILKEYKKTLRELDILEKKERLHFLDHLKRQKMLNNKELFLTLIRLSLK